MWLKKEDFAKRMAIKKRIENREIATRFSTIFMAHSCLRHTAYYRHSDFIRTASIS